MKRLFLIISATLVVSFLLATCVYAEVPHLIRFQGKVTDTAGAPLSGAYNVTFRIYNAETGGTLLWSETQSAVPVNNGIFTVLLGNVAALDLPFDESYWLSMEVNDDGEMAPRQTVSSVGYAIHAETAERFIEGETVPGGAIILWRGTSCPVGYTRVAELDGKFIVGGATYNAAAGGSNTQTHTIPSHTHSIKVTGYSYNNNPPNGSIATSCQSCNGHGANRIAADYISTEGWGGTTGSGDSRPEFATVIFCQKE